MQVVSIVIILAIMGLIATFCIGSLILLASIAANQREQTSLLRKLQNTLHLPGTPESAPQPETQPLAPPEPVAVAEPLAPPPEPAPVIEPPPPPEPVAAIEPLAPPPEAEAEAGPAMALPPPLPRRQSELELAALSRLRMVKNWFFFGQSESPPAGQPIEKLLAVTWLLRAGVLVILFTAVFLLKLSIERGFLQPPGRVAISYLTGTLLLLAGLHQRTSSYRRLGQAVTGLGLAMFYFSSFALVSLYHLAPAQAGTLLMILTTVAAGVIAHRRNAPAIAIIAMVGGYATPILLSTGQKNYPGLFAYMFMLGSGVLWLATRRHWLPLNWLGMLLTYLLYALAFTRQYADGDFTVLIVSLSAFFVQYSLVVFLYHLRRRQPATVLEICGLLANTTLFFILAWLTIDRAYDDRLAFAALPLGLTLYYKLHALCLLRRRHQDKGLLLAFLGLAALCLTLTFPLVASRVWLGAAWALQALLILWLGYRMNSRFLRAFAWGLLAFCLGRFLCVDLFRAFNNVFPPPTADRAFWQEFTDRLVQFGIPLLALAGAARLARRPPAESPLQIPAQCDIQNRLAPSLNLGMSAFVLCLALLFLYLNFEIYRTIGVVCLQLRPAALSWLWAAAALLALALGTATRLRFWFIAAICLALGLLGKTLAIDFLPHALNNGSYPYCYATIADAFWQESIMRLLNVITPVAFFLVVARKLADGPCEPRLARLCQRLWPALLFLYATWELNTVLHYKLPEMRGGGISVLWGVFALAFVYRGLRNNLFWLRTLGLALFALVVVKVFVFDMGHLQAIYRVLAFFLFGLLLMFAAFIYLKFWADSPERK